MFPRLGLRLSQTGLGLRPSRHILFKRTVKTPTIDWKPIKSSVSNLARAENQEKQKGFRRFILGLMIAMPVITFWLGCWQVKRLKWKVDLIARCEHLLAEPPLENLPAELDPSVIPEYEYRRFKIKGKFDYSQELFLGPRIRNGELGYLLITPFIRADGGKPILIERGWIAKEKVIPETRNKGYLSHLSLPQGEIEIEAMFRTMPKKSFMQYEHEPGTRLFHVPDVEAMAKETGSLPIYAQMMYSLKDKNDWHGPQEATEKKSSWKRLFLAGPKNPNSEHLPESDTDTTLQYQEFEFVNQGVPLAAIPKVNFTNNHMQYLITWFGISLASTALLIYSLYKRKSSGSAEKVIEAKRKEMKKTFLVH